MAAPGTELHDASNQRRSPEVFETTQNDREDVVDESNEALEEVVLEQVLSGTVHLEPSDVTEANGRPGQYCRVKQFKPRSSVLTELWSTERGRTIYNLLVVIFVNLLVNTAIDEIAVGKLDLGSSTVAWNFGKLLPAISIWSCMVVCTLVAYWAFFTWAYFRSGLTTWACRAWDVACVVTFLSFQAGLLLIPPAIAIPHNLPIATAIALYLEQMRMIMKVYAFVRTNAPRVLSPSPDIPPCPPFSRYLYFLFCPTLLYRDTYPRTKTIRWKFVAQSFTEVVVCVFFICYLFQRHILPQHRAFNLLPATYAEIMSLIFRTALPGFLSCFLCFYVILHSWQNAWAEMLRFADRLFYLDWWNASSYAAYYRRWNVIVHDWLYEFIYKDFCVALKVTGRVAPTVIVFMTSAVVHEYGLSLAFGFFCPMMLLQFGILGMCLAFVPTENTKWGNTFFLLLYSFGTGLMASVYTMEWYSRIHCAPLRESALEDFFVPRLLNCTPVSLIRDRLT